MSAQIWQAGPTMSGRRVPAVFATFARRRTWAELGYAVAGLGIGIGGFVFTVVTLAVGGGLIVTFVGLPLIALTGLASRYAGDGLRRFANGVLGWGIPPAQRFRARPGLFGWLGSCLTDGTAWRARAYLLLKFPLGIAGFVVAVTFWGYGLGGLTYWAWRPFLPCQRDGAGRCHTAAAFGPHLYLDTAPRIVAFTIIGVLILLAAPWVTHGVLQLDRLLMRGLLGLTSDAERVAQLERTRAVAVDDSAEMLRRIERDLHDGAQARLVSLAMNVGLAREKLAEGDDPDGATRLLDDAHATAKQAIVELRDLARGIHPPVLDAGLDAALSTLAAHSAVPVRLDVSLDDRPDPAIETMAYFCVAELITNVAKHADARSATVSGRTGNNRLSLAVVDDGRGGAVMGGGTGLRGLIERVSTVDGSLSIDSPPGGPTTVRIDLPIRARVSP